MAVVRTRREPPWLFQRQRCGAPYTSAVGGTWIAVQNLPLVRRGTGPMTANTRNINTLMPCVRDPTS
jgi:hypothetical protein